MNGWALGIGGCRNLLHFAGHAHLSVVRLLLSAVQFAARRAAIHLWSTACNNRIGYRNGLPVVVNNFKKQSDPDSALHLGLRRVLSALIFYLILFTPVTVVSTKKSAPADFSGCAKCSIYFNNCRCWVPLIVCIITRLESSIYSGSVFNPNAFF